MKKGLMRQVLRKGVAVFSCAALVSTMLVPVASADDSTEIKWTVPTVEKALGNLVTAGAHRANEPVCEIVGVTNTSLNNSGGAPTSSDSLATAQTYAKMGIYGSVANVNANPYIWNYFYNFYAAEYGMTTSTNAAHLSTQSSGPNAAMTKVEEEYGTSADLSWRPNMLIGVAGGSSSGGSSMGGSSMGGDSSGGGMMMPSDDEYQDLLELADAGNWSGYTDLILEIRSWTDQEDGSIPSDVPADEADELYTLNDAGTYTNADGNTVVYSEHYMAGDYCYNPVGVDYAANTIEDCCDTLYTVAQIAEDVMEADSSVSVRYGNPTTIAYKFELYAKATKWYVLKQLAATGASQKKICYVSSYDATAGTVDVAQLAADTDTEGSSTKFYAAIEGTVIDLGQSAEETATEVTDFAGTRTTYSYTLTVAALAEADVIFAADIEGVEALLEGTSFSGVVYGTDTPDGTYWGGVSSCIEGIEMVGMLQGMIYPEYINPVSAVCYYQDEFYHLTNTALNDSLYLTCGDITLPEGYAWNANEYVYEDMQAIIDEGTAYYFANKEAMDEAVVYMAASELLTAAYAEGAEAFFAMVDPQDDEGTSGNPVTQDDVDALEAQIAELESEITELESTISGLESEITALKSEISDLESKLAAATTTNTDLASQLATAKSSLESAQSDLATAKSSLATAQSSLESDQTQITSLQSQVSTLESDLEAAKSASTELESQLASAKSDLESAQTQVTELTTELNSANATIESLENQLATQTPSEAQEITVTSYKAFKAKKVKKAAKSFKVAKAAGTLTVKKLSGSKKLTVSKSGKITVKKGTKKGVYTVKLKISAAATDTYIGTSTKVTVTVVVK